MSKLQLKSVPKSYRPTEACLYSISAPEYYDLLPSVAISLIRSGDEKTYVGVTANKLSKRFTDHKATRNGEWRQATGPFIYENGYTFEQCVRVLAEGTMEEMLALENELRPVPNMGLNRKAGG
jgi:predicted GIY-YIG superfamily endonuclease